MGINAPEIRGFTYLQGVAIASPCLLCLLLFNPAPRFCVGAFYLLFTMSSEMYQDLIQYQAKRIEALANELKKQEETINELKKKINDEK